MNVTIYLMHMFSVFSQFKYNRGNDIYFVGSSFSHGNYNSWDAVETHKAFFKHCLHSTPLIVYGFWQNCWDILFFVLFWRQGFSV